MQQLFGLTCTHSRFSAILHLVIPIAFVVVAHFHLGESARTAVERGREGGRAREPDGRRKSRSGIWGGRRRCRRSPTERGGREGEGAGVEESGVDEEDGQTNRRTDRRGTANFEPNFPRSALSRSA